MHQEELKLTHINRENCTWVPWRDYTVLAYYDLISSYIEKIEQFCYKVTISRGFGD
jgi:hypothetical protein